MRPNLCLTYSKLTQTLTPTIALAWPYSINPNLKDVAIAHKVFGLNPDPLLLTGSIASPVHINHAPAHRPNQIHVCQLFQISLATSLRLGLVLVLWARAGVTGVARYILTYG